MSNQGVVIVTEENYFETGIGKEQVELRDEM